MTRKELSYWTLMQLYLGHVKKGDYVSFRAIYNEPPKHDPQTGRLLHNSHAKANFSVPVATLREKFLSDGGIFDQLTAYNRTPEKPCNIYFGVNPRVDAQNKKSSVKGFVAFYLDLDVTPEYDFEARMMQVAFWKDANFAPTFVVASGHGLQAYWCLEKLVDCDKGELVLKRMVHITGCEVKGNTWDCTRIFRLPGFLNVKYWYQDDTPECYVVYPEPHIIEKSYKDRTPLERHYVGGLTNG